MIADVWRWLVGPDSWSGPDGIGARALEHVGYSVVVVIVAALIAIPLGLYVGHTRRGQWLVSLANALRAVPTLGLLFAVTLWLGPHLRGDTAFLIPSLIVLVILAIPPILSGAYAGVQAVDPAARDAARGVGMTQPEVLRQVEIPCALPLLLSGLRSAVLQVIATATIAAVVGLGGLGRYLIDGIAEGNYAKTAGGSILVAVMALLADGLLAVVQRTVVSPGLAPHRGRRRKTTTSAPVEVTSAG